MPSDLELIGTCALFRGLPPAAIAELGAAAAVERFEKKVLLFHEGEPARALWMLRAGRLKLTKLGGNGQEIVVRFLIPGDPFGAIAILAGARYPVSAEAVEACEAFSWTPADVAALVERYPAIGMNSARVMSERMQELQERYRELATERVAQRVARAILRLARQTGRRVEGGVLLDLPLSRQDLAELTGTTLFTISRTLSEWEQQGLVELGRERVLIKSPHGLVTIAEDLPS
ncbi:MAG: Crp/Fnr family transcriptional regulator [Acidobacteriota bacterium]